MEKEVSDLRKDLAAFMDWAKQSQECNQKNLCILNENFNLLLKLFISKNDTLELGKFNSKRVAITNKSGKKAEKKKVTSDCTAVPSLVLPSAAYEGVNDFSDDDEDLEDSLRINPISFNMFPTDKRKENKLLIDEHKDEKISSDTIENNIEMNLKLIQGYKSSAPIKFTGKKLEEKLSELKKECEKKCKKFPNAMKVPESYLEYGAARGWDMFKVRKNFHRRRRRLQLQTFTSLTSNTMKKRKCLQKRKISLGKCSPVLNLTPEQLEANLKTLHEKHKKSKSRLPIPEFYFKFGAARGWTITQVRQKYYSRCYNNRTENANIIKT